MLLNLDTTSYACLIATINIPSVLYALQSEAVPAGSAVEMTLELAEIHRTEEVTEDKGVMKKSLQVREQRQAHRDFLLWMPAMRRIEY